MKGFLAVFGRELEERRLLLPFGLLIGLVPLLIPLVPGLPAGASPPEARAGAAISLGLAVSLVLALTLGASVLGRDLAERRIAFWFGRPLTGWAIWAGKLGAAALLAIGSGLLVLVPALVLGDFASMSRIATGGGQPGSAVLGLSCAVLLALLAAHTFGTLVRARSPWLALDFVAAVAVFAIAWSAHRALLHAGAAGSLADAYPWLFTATLAALIVASAVQILSGRTDLQRGYRILSRVMWGLLLAAVLGFAAFTRWTLDVSVADLTNVTNLSASPSGRFVAIEGFAAHRSGYKPTLLLDTVSGSSLALGGESWFSFWGPVAFSEDDRRVAWFAPEGVANLSHLDLYTLDLTRPTARPVASPISLRVSTPFALSPDGRLISTAENDRWLVEEVDSGRLLLSASLQVPVSIGAAQLRFVGPRRVRLFQGEWERDADGTNRSFFSTYELALGDPHVRMLSRIERHSNPAMQLSPTGDRLLTIERDPERLLLYDLTTGAVTAEIAQADPIVRAGRGVMAWFLPDGRLVQTKEGLPNGRTVRLTLLDRNGVATGPERSLDARHALLGGQPDPDHLVLALSPSPSGGSGAPSRLVVLDLRDGGVRQVATGLVPAYAWRPAAWRTGPPSAPANLYRTLQGDLVELDFATGRQRVVVKQSFLFDERSAPPAIAR